MGLKTAYFDCTFGAAGDMLVGACIDCGVPHEYIEEQLRKLNLPGESFTTTAGRVHRASIHATKFDVWVDDRSEEGHAHGHDYNHDQDQDHDHEHEHEHEHDHDHKHEHGHDEHSDEYNDHENSHAHSHSHSHSHGHSHSHSPSHSHSHASTAHPVRPASSGEGREQLTEQLKTHRALSEILKIIASSDLDQAVKELASRIFERLGRAESAVHGIAIDSIQFHEVGAVDAICDIVGFAIAYNKLGIQAAAVSPVPLGTGTVRTMHGKYPVPGPAVLALLQEAGAPTSELALPYECLTPTGAAILCTIGASFGAPPAFHRMESVGYGAGSLNPGSHPNVVRLIVGEASGVAVSPSAPGVETTVGAEASASYQAEIVAVVEANIDDMTPPVMAHAMEQLLQAGALDVCLTPIVMKKGRLAQKLSVIARPADRQKMNSIILSETTTIGTRSYYCERLTLSRDFQEVSIGDGPKIRLKVARDGSGKVINVQPEYEDCLAFARASNVPLKEVLIMCLSKASDLLESRKKV